MIPDNSPTPAATPIATSSAPATKQAMPKKRGLNQSISIEDIKKKARMLHAVFKNTSILLILVNLFAFTWLTMDLHPDNRYLSALDTQNVGKQYIESSTRYEEIDINLQSTTFELSQLEEKIENKQYLEFQTEVDDIKSDQLIWFDREEGETTLFGMLDSFERLATYFNDRKYNDPQKIVSGRKGQILIENISVSRDQANVSVQTSQILGRVFFLVNEFVEIVNSLPFYQNADIRSFVREENELGDDSMSFSINLTRQQNPEKDSQNPYIEVDAADGRWTEYLDWLQARTQ